MEKHVTEAIHEAVHQVGQPSEVADLIARWFQDAAAGKVSMTNSTMVQSRLNALLEAVRVEED